MKNVMRKVVLMSLLAASISLQYWLDNSEKAEREAWDNYLWHQYYVTSLRAELLNPETANLTDLNNFNYHRRAMGLSLASLSISNEKMKEVERNCHKNAAKYLYTHMEKYDFDLETYNKLQEEAKLAGISLKEIFTPKQVSINVIQRNGRLLYRNGWRQATDKEIEKFKAIEARGEEQRRKYAAEAKARREACLKENPPKYFAVGDFPDVEFKPKAEETSWIDVLLGTKTITLSAQVPVNTHLNIRVEDTCPSSFREDNISINGVPLTNYGTNDWGNAGFTFENGFIVSTWRHTGNGYEVPTYVDITDIFARDGLKVVGGYIYPI